MMTPILLTLAQTMEQWGWAPKSWSGLVAIGIVVGGIIAWFSTREARKRETEANERTVKAYRETVTATEHQLAVMTKERDNYREMLHEERKMHNAAQLRIKELELRPDITALFHASETFYGEQTKVAAEQIKVVSELAKSFRDHDQRVTERMNPIYASLQKMGDGIAELLRRSVPAKQK